MPVLGDFSQSVTVAGLPALVHDLSVKTSSSERVVSIDFVLELLQVPGQAAAFNSAYIGEPVVVTQAVDGNSQTWEAIITNVAERRNGAFTFKRVQCRSLEYLASHTRFLDQWVRVPASIVVAEAWQRHALGAPALRNLSLAGIDFNGTIIEEYASKYDSLFDVMDSVCLLTGWAWKIRNGTVLFFDPLLNIGPSITQGSRGIVRDTLELKQSLEGVYNVFRGQAWSYRTLSISNNFQPSDCIDGFRFDPSILKGVEVVGEPRIVQQKWRDLGLEVANVDENGILELNKSITANNEINGTMTVELRIRSLHWVERFDQASLELYGRRDAPPLSDNGGDNIRAVTQKLDELLYHRAHPSYDVKLEVVGVGWEPDQVVNVTLLDPQFTAQLYVTDVTRTTDGSDLSVVLSLTSPSEVVEGDSVPASQPRRSLSGVDPAYEIGRRVERLERRNAHPAASLGYNTDVTGVLSGVDESSDNAGWASATNFRDIGEPVGDGHGWAATVGTVFEPLASDSAGWQGATEVVLKPDVIAAATGWAGALVAALAVKHEPIERRGWTGTTTGTPPQPFATPRQQTGWNATISVMAVVESFMAADDDVNLPIVRLDDADSAGWTGTTAVEQRTKATNGRGWKQSVTVTNLSNVGLAIDDDVAMPSANVSANDEIAL